MSQAETDFPALAGQMLDIDSPAGRSVLSDGRLASHPVLPPWVPQATALAAPAVSPAPEAAPAPRQGTPTHTREDVITVDIREYDPNFPDVASLLDTLTPESGATLLKYLRDTETKLFREAATAEANRAAAQRRVDDILAEVQAKYGVSTPEELERIQADQKARILRAAEALHGRLPVAAAAE